MKQFKWSKNTRFSENELENFCLSCPSTRLEHSPKWLRILNKTYSLKSHYYVLANETKIHAACPLVFVRKPFLGGIKALSMPYLAAAGIVSKNGFAPRELEIDLIASIDNLSRPDSIELRTADTCDFSNFCISRLKLNSFPNDSLMSLSGNLRRKVKKALTEGGRRAG